MNESSNQHSVMKPMHTNNIQSVRNDTMKSVLQTQSNEPKLAFSLHGFKSQMKQREAEMSKITMSLNSNRNIVNLINQELEREGVDQQKLL